jgi:hypothetical protein
MPAISLRNHAQRLRALSWRDMARYAWLVLLGMVTLKLLLPAGLRSSMRPLILLAPILPFIAKDLSHWPDARARLRAAIAARNSRGLATACLPPEIPGLVRVDAAMRQGCMHWLRRRPQPALPAGRVFTYLERGSYRTGIAIVLTATLFELPMLAVLLPLFVHDAHELLVLHVLFAFGSLSTLVWVLGDRWHVGRGCHVLTGAGLVLQVGARTTGTIPLGAIADCRRIDLTPDQWCRSNGIARNKTVPASPLDKPNVVLILKPGRLVRLHHMGIERTGPHCVFLYVDRPDDLLHALLARPGGARAA